MEFVNSAGFFNMSKYFSPGVFGIAGAVTALIYLFSACSGDKQPQKKAAKVKMVLPEPFRFHKAVEVKPGLTFDVVSWGRGAELTGAFLILRSDSSGMKYRSVSGELDGRIADVWNMDMDADGNPEIFIQSKGADKDDYLKMYVYEFDDNGSSKELHFPDLSSSTKKNYRGKDSVYVRNGELFRTFPLYAEDDTTGVKPTGKKLLQYNLNGNSFSVKEISPDSH